jgi:hypothetical protein
LGGDHGNDTVMAGGGRDFVDSGLGSDSVAGGDGPDWLTVDDVDDTFKDTVSGGDGHDVIIVNNRPASTDTVSCGGGFDRVAADAKDQVLSDCESLRRGPAVQNALWEKFEELGFDKVSNGLAPDPTVSD